MLEDRRQKIAVKQRLWNEEDKQIAVIGQQKSERLKRMQSECGEDEPLPKAKIQDQDFDARKNQFRYQEKEAEKQAEDRKERLRIYDENLTALAEFSDLPLGEQIVWEQDFQEMDGQNLRNYKGVLIRDHKQKERDGRDARERLTRLLNRVVRMEQFQEDFYRKPLEAMLELTGDASAVLRQLSTTLQSYDSLIEKLMVDISLVEKEKKKIVELMEDYIREVHQNLGRIDHNSTITIRERPVKMLKLQIPEWEENENLYLIRLQDMIDEITQKGLRLFEQNENAQEYFGTQITTRNLYDTVVGIGNVQIRLYKIEAQREYPITWTEVARNSGGEGFLSAFVILSSLLYYMRKDDTDIFADRNEGKVLVMDNPFAQTNASHLLKPLMDVAKKSNTQLICLTGLGGESIYNRFDNIYVLNLIAASLRNGMQYLKADHLRGNEPETMIVSQIEVMEQQELVF
jgi:acylphosphatase